MHASARARGAAPWPAPVAGTIGVTFLARTSSYEYMDEGLSALRPAPSQSPLLLSQPRLSASARRSDLVQQLALGLAGLEVLVPLDGLGDVEDLVDADVEVAGLDPAEDLIGAHHELGAIGDVVE